MVPSSFLFLQALVELARIELATPWLQTVVGVPATVHQSPVLKLNRAAHCFTRPWTVAVIRPGCCQNCCQSPTAISSKAAATFLSAPLIM